MGQRFGGWGKWGQNRPFGTGANMQGVGQQVPGAVPGQPPVMLNGQPYAYAQAPGAAGGTPIPSAQPGVAGGAATIAHPQLTTNGGFFGFDPTSAASNATALPSAQVPVGFNNGPAGYGQTPGPLNSAPFSPTPTAATINGAPFPTAQSPVTLSGQPYAYAQAPGAAGGTPISPFPNQTAANGAPFSATPTAVTLNGQPYGYSQAPAGGAPLPSIQTPGALNGTPFPTGQSAVTLSGQPYAYTQSPGAVGGTLVPPGQSPGALNGAAFSPTAPAPTLTGQAPGAAGGATFSQTPTAVTLNGRPFNPAAARGGKFGAGGKTFAAGSKTAAATSGGKIAAGKTAATGLAGGKILLGLLGLTGLVVAGVGLSSLSRHKPPPPPPRRKKKRANLMSNILKLLRGKFIFFVLTVLGFLLIAAGGRILYRWNFKPYHLIVGVSSAKGEGYIILQALRSVALRRYPRIEITVQETGTPTEAMSRLEKGTAQLAVVQADVPPGPQARSVAVLFQDDFQLIARRGIKADPRRSPTDKNQPASSDSTAGAVMHFIELKNKRIALPRTGGQFASFLFLANHFGLKYEDFTFVGVDDDSADLAFARNDADAVFHVKSLHNENMVQLVSKGDADFVPIDEVPAMHEMFPAYFATTIPKATYLGSPPIPSIDLPTVGTLRLLLARSDVDAEVIYALTELLMDHRGEIVEAIPEDVKWVRPLITHSERPMRGAGADASLHEGAIDFYSRDQSTFVSGHADLLAWMATAFIIFGLWTNELRRFIASIQKYRSDKYNSRLLELIQEIEQSASNSELEPVEAELMHMMSVAVEDLGDDKLADASFESFQTVWQVAMESIRRRQKFLGVSGGKASAPTGSEIQIPGRTSVAEKLSLARYLQPRN